MLSSCGFSQSMFVNEGVSQLVLTTDTEPTTFNYPLTLRPYDFLRFVGEGLVRENGVTSKIEPALAEFWQISKNQKHITFTLRKNLRWSDGKSLTSDDVIFTFQEIYFNNSIPNIFSDFLRIGNKKIFPSIHKLDNRTVEFILPEPFAPFVRYLAKLFIMPAHALQESLISTDARGNSLFLYQWNTNTNPNQIISCGPYRIRSYIPSQRLILERNSYYWNFTEKETGKPYIQHIFLAIIPSPDTRLIQFRSGQLDAVQVPPEMFSLLKREEKQGKYTIYRGGTWFSPPFISFNLNRGFNAQEQPLVNPIKSKWFNNLKFRQAIAFAINRERLNNNIYRGLGELRHSPLRKESPYYFSPEQGLIVYSYDPQKAKQILLSAGFEYSSQNQLLDWDKNRVKFTILVKLEDQDRVEMAVQIKENLAKIGIQTTVQVLANNTIQQKLLQTKDWECYLGASGVPGADVEPHLLSFFWSSRGSFHIFNQGSPVGQPTLKGWEVSDWEQEIDRLLASGVKVLEHNKRKQIYAQMQQIIARELPVFWLVSPFSFEAVRNRVQNLQFSPSEGAFWNIEDLKVQK